MSTVSTRQRKKTPQGEEYGMERLQTKDRRFKKEIRAVFEKIEKIKRDLEQAGSGISPRDLAELRTLLQQASNILETINGIKNEIAKCNVEEAELMAVLQCTKGQNDRLQAQLVAFQGWIDTFPEAPPDEEEVFHEAPQEEDIQLQAAGTSASVVLDPPRNAPPPPRPPSEPSPSVRSGSHRSNRSHRSGSSRGSQASETTRKRLAAIIELKRISEMRKQQEQWYREDEEERRREERAEEEARREEEEAREGARRREEEARRREEEARRQEEEAHHEQERARRRRQHEKEEAQCQEQCRAKDRALQAQERDVRYELMLQQELEIAENDDQRLVDADHDPRDDHRFRREVPDRPTSPKALQYRQPTPTESDQQVAVTNSAQPTESGTTAQSSESTQPPPPSVSKTGTSTTTPTIDAAAIAEHLFIGPPKVEMFNGDPTEFIQFISSFESSIAAKTLDSVLRMNKLFEFLGPKVRPLVQLHRLDKENGYKKCLDTLWEFFGNPVTVAAALLESLREKTTPIRADDTMGLLRFSLEIGTALSTVEAMGKL